MLSLQEIEDAKAGLQKRLEGARWLLQKRRDAIEANEQLAALLVSDINQIKRYQHAIALAEQEVRARL